MKRCYGRSWNTYIIIPSSVAIWIGSIMGVVWRGAPRPVTAFPRGARERDERDNGVEKT
jgi:hypothetical protein